MHSASPSRTAFRGKSTKLQSLPTVIVCAFVFCFVWTVYRPFVLVFRSSISYTRNVDTVHHVTCCCWTSGRGEKPCHGQKHVRIFHCGRFRGWSEGSELAAARLLRPAAFRRATPTPGQMCTEPDTFGATHRDGTRLSELPHEPKDTRNTRQTAFILWVWRFVI